MTKASADKGMPGRCAQGLIDVLEGNYGRGSYQDALRREKGSVREVARR